MANAAPLAFVQIGIVLLLRVLIALGMIEMCKLWVRALMGKSSGLFDWVPLVKGWTKSLERAAENRVSKTFGHIAGGGQRMVGWWFYGAARSLKTLGDELYATTLTTYLGLQRLSASVNHRIHVAQIPQTKRGAIIERTVRTIITTPKGAIVNWVKTQLRLLETRIRREIARGASVNLPGQLHALRLRLNRLEKRPDAAAKVLPKHGKRIWDKGAIALVAGALAAMGLGSLRCRNTQRATKGLCGMDKNLLDSVLLDTLAVFGTVSLVEFARELQQPIGVWARWMRWFWRVADDKPNLISG